MKTIFDGEVRKELIQRISTLGETDKPLWGTMNVLQMLNHNTYWNDWVLWLAGWRVRWLAR